MGPSSLLLAVCPEDAGPEGILQTHEGDLYEVQPSKVSLHDLVSVSTGPLLPGCFLPGGTGKGTLWEAGLPVT